MSPVADTVRVIDHEAEALSILSYAEATDDVALAQVHATLAVAQAIQELSQTLAYVTSSLDAPIVEALWSMARGGEPRG